MNADWLTWIRSTVLFGLTGLALLLPLGRQWPAPEFRQARRAVVMGASLFWPAFAFTLVQMTWRGYYEFFYPAWMKWGAAALALLIYPTYAFGAHWLAVRLPGYPLLWFCLMVGALAAGEHVLAWIFVDLPNRVPYLRGAPLPAVMLFAFFEYQVYWGVVLWLGWTLTYIARWRHK